MLQERISFCYPWSTCWMFLQACPNRVSVETSVGIGGFVEAHVDTFGPLACEDIGP